MVVVLLSVSAIIVSTLLDQVFQSPPSYAKVENLFLCSFLLIEREMWDMEIVIGKGFGSYTKIR